MIGYIKKDIIKILIINFVYLVSLINAMEKQSNNNIDKKLEIAIESFNKNYCVFQKNGINNNKILATSYIEQIGEEYLSNFSKYITIDPNNGNDLCHFKAAILQNIYKNKTYPKKNLLIGISAILTSKSSHPFDYMQMNLSKAEMLNNLSIFYGIKKDKKGESINQITSNTGLERILAELTTLSTINDVHFISTEEQNQQIKNNIIASTIPLSISRSNNKIIKYTPNFPSATEYLLNNNQFIVEVTPLRLINPLKEIVERKDEKLIGSGIKEKSFVYTQGIDKKEGEVAIVVHMPLILPESNKNQDPKYIFVDILKKQFGNDIKNIIDNGAVVHPLYPPITYNKENINQINEATIGLGEDFSKNIQKKINLYNETTCYCGIGIEKSEKDDLCDVYLKPGSQIYQYATVANLKNPIIGIGHIQIGELQKEKYNEQK
jgi:hypothetical protein